MFGLVLTLQVSSQQVEPGEQDDGRQRRHQQLQASAAQQAHGGAVLRAVGLGVRGEGGGGVQVGFNPSMDVCSIVSSEEDRGEEAVRPQHLIPQDPENCKT